jgi:hypothetical protein
MDTYMNIDNVELSLENIALLHVVPHKIARRKSGNSNPDTTRSLCRGWVIQLATARPPETCRYFHHQTLHSLH